MLIRNSKERESELSGRVCDTFFDDSVLEIEVGNYRLFVNSKTRGNNCLTYSNTLSAVAGTGTFIYKRCGPKESLQLLLDDFNKERFSPSELLGHYFIFLILPLGLKILTDGTGLIKAYHDRGGSYLSSSFLMAASLQEKLTLNKSAAIENLVTGALISPDTLVNEICCFSSRSHILFPDIAFLTPERNFTGVIPQNRVESVKRESILIDDYFRACSRLANECGADIGLTGGYDSRLILAHAVRNFNDIQVHSHYRKYETEEWRVAKEIADGERLQFVSPKVIPTEEMDDDTLLRTIESSYKYCDGAIRLHNNWLEEYNTWEYQARIMGNMLLGVNGIGGEQYRNHDRLYIKPWLFKQWIKYYYIRRTSGNLFLCSKDEREIVFSIMCKISDLLGFSKSKQWIKLSDLKRIQNEVMIPAYRGTITDAANRYAWSLSPFADVHLSTSAYNIVRYLRSSRNFEAELIREASPNLAHYRTDYGYNLLGGEPWSYRLASTLFENLLPAAMKWKIREVIRKGKQETAVVKKIRSSAVLQVYFQKTVHAGLPLSEEMLISREVTACMAVSLGFFLEKLNIEVES